MYFIATADTCLILLTVLEKISGPNVSQCVTTLFKPTAITTFHIPIRFWDIPDKFHSKLTIGTDFRKIMFWTPLRWKIHRGIPWTALSWIFWLERCNDFSARLRRTVCTKRCEKSTCCFWALYKTDHRKRFSIFGFVGTKYNEFEAPIGKERQHVFHSSGFGGRIFHGLLNQSTGFPREMISLCNYKPYGT